MISEIEVRHRYTLACAGLRQAAEPSADCGASGHPLLDHLVGRRQQRFRDGEAERPSGLEVDDEIELGDLSQPSWRCARFV